VNFFLWLVIVVPILIIVIGASNKIFTWRVPFVQPLQPDNRDAFVALGAISFVGLALYFLSLGAQIETFDLMGIKGTVRREVKQEVKQEIKPEIDKIHNLIRDLYAARKVEVFDARNWARLTAKGDRLSVILQTEPLPETVMVYRGSLVVTPNDIRVNGRTVSWEGSAQYDYPVVIHYYAKQPDVVNAPAQSR
jgi:hypothetical protein